MVFSLLTYGFFKIILASLFSFVFTFSCLYFFKKELFYFLIYNFTSRFANFTLLSTGVLDIFWLEIKLLFFISFFCTIGIFFIFLFLYTLQGLYILEITIFLFFFFILLFYIFFLYLFSLYFLPNIILFSFSLSELGGISFDLSIEKYVLFCLFSFLFLILLTIVCILFFYLTFISNFKVTILRGLNFFLIFVFLLFVIPPDIFMHCIFFLFFFFFVEIFIFLRFFVYEIFLNKKQPYIKSKIDEK